VPAVEFESGHFRLDIKTPPGLVAVEMRSLKSRGGATQLIVSDEMKTELKDDGRSPDRKAKDGIYSGFIPGDLKEEIQRYETNVMTLKRDLPIPVFDGREFVELKPGSAFIRPRTAVRLPILEVSGGYDVVIENSIAITDLSVIESPDYTFNPCDTNNGFDELGQPIGAGQPNGVWTFGHLMNELAAAGGVSASDLCMNWLDHWTQDQTINGYTAAQRFHVKSQIIAAWPTEADETLSMSRAPFRLLGIFNRIDLRRGTYGTASSAGELRFVYVFNPCGEGVRPFYVIFEYGVAKRGCAVRAWGREWAELSTLKLGSTAYLEALAKLTTEVTNLHSNPQGHKLNQLRTNELLSPYSSLALGKMAPVPDNIGKAIPDVPEDDPPVDGAPWELREFHIVNGLLQQKSVVATPDISMNQTAWLTGVINTIPVFGLPVVPINEEAASSLNPANFFWSAPSVTINARHKMSLNTCNACHGRETDTVFTHVTATDWGSPPVLSGFLTGTTVVDPIDSSVSRTFGDLERRRQALQNLVDNPCVSQLLPVARSMPVLSH